MRQPSLRSTPRRAACGLGLATLLLGCGAPPNEHPTAELSGRVTIDGQPVSQGSLQFIPIESGQPAAAEIVAGEYLAEQVPLGKVRVLVTALRPTGRIINEGGHEFPEQENLVPEKDRSGIKLEVHDDNAQQHISLPTP